MPTPEPPRLSPRSSLGQQGPYIVLEHRVSAEDDFHSAARDVFDLLRAAQQQHPGGKRGLIVTIEGHKGDRVGYDEDFFEFQQEFMLGAMGQYFTWIQLPLTGKLANPQPQKDDIPDRLRIEAEASAD